MLGTSIAITLTLCYYSIRTIKLFKRSVAARAWVYISLSGIFFSIGVASFLLDNLFSIGMLQLGGILMVVGGTFLLLGLRKNYLFWSSKDHFT